MKETGLTISRFLFDLGQGQPKGVSCLGTYFAELGDPIAGHPRYPLPAKDKRPGIPRTRWKVHIGKEVTQLDGPSAHAKRYKSIAGFANCKGQRKIKAVLIQEAFPRIFDWQR